MLAALLMPSVGFLTLTPGDVIDYAFIGQQVKEDEEHYEIQEIVYDPWNAELLWDGSNNRFGSRASLSRRTIDETDRVPFDCLARDLGSPEALQSAANQCEPPTILVAGRQ